MNKDIIKLYKFIQPLHNLIVLQFQKLNYLNILVISG